MTKRYLFALITLCLVLGPLPTLAQGPAEQVDLAAMSRIRDEGFRNSKVMETLAYLTDVIGPRLTGSPQNKQGAEWARTQLASWGLQNAQLHKWGPFGRGWSAEQVSVRMVAPTATPLIAVPKAWTPGTSGVVRGKVVRVAKLPDSEEALAPYKGKLAGAVILVGTERKLEPLTGPIAKRYTDEELADVHEYEIPGDRPGRRGGPDFDREAAKRSFMFGRRLNQFLADEKVLAVVEGSSWDRGVVRIGGAGSREPGEPVGVPQLVLAVEHANRIHRLLDRKMDVELELDVRAGYHDQDLHSYNVIAEIPGTDPKLKDEVVMIGAHLDSWHAGTGATDNAAGSAVAMEAVRILKSLDIRPRRTIRVALWSGEEQGLLGSRAYVADMFASRPEPADPAQKKLPSWLRDAPAGPLSVKPSHGKITAYFNLDNGTGKIRGVYAQENAAIVPIFKAWLEPFADLGATTVSMRNTGSTDHVSFDSVGIPGFQFIQDPVEYSGDAKGLTHHSNMDVYDRLQREDMMQASVVMAAFLYNAAMRDTMLPRKAMPKDPAPGQRSGRGYEEEHDH